MRVLKMVTRTLVVCGCWHPESWTSPLKTLLYQLYSVIVVLLVYSVTFYQIMDLLLVVETMDEFADNLYMLTAMMTGCQKLANMLLSHKKIRELIDTFQKEPFDPQSDEELEIRAKFEKTTHTNTVMYASLLTVSCAVYSAMVFFKSEKWPLLFRAWLPYNYSTTSLYLPTVAQQSLAVYYGALNHAACDSLFCGLMIHVCSQLEILGHRLNKIARGEIATIKSCIHFHDKVYRYAEKLNTQFKMIIFMQFLASAVIVSFNLYRVTQFTNLGPKLFEIIMYSQCIMIQIFIYCWYGNEVKLKVRNHYSFWPDFVIILGWCMLNIVFSNKTLCTSSQRFEIADNYFLITLRNLRIVEKNILFEKMAFPVLANLIYSSIYQSIELSDAVHKMNWIELDNIQRRMILMMMRRASVPIEFTSIHIATLNLESYVTILKTSYSAYSVLQ